MKIIHLARSVILVGSLLSGLGACDAGEASLALGPRPRLVSYQPQAGEGLDCDPTADNCGFPSNWPLVFVLDRWLRPNTATRQSIRVAPVGTQADVEWEPHYDLVARSVTYRPRGGWDEGYVFDLRLFDPTTPNANWGFRSYNGLLLDPSGLPANILFRVGPRVTPSPSESAATPAPNAASCREAMAAFAAAGCSASNCHRSAVGCATAACQPSAGLGLDTVAGLSSAIGRVARATDRGAESGVATLMPERFGVNLALVEAGEPSLSLVMYRMLLGRDAYRNRDGQFVVSPPAAEELERARSWFGVTGEMPPASVGWPAEASPIDLVTAIERWISDGAPTSDCDQQ